MAYQFRPRKSFEHSLSRLAQLDPSIVDETKDAINISSHPRLFQGHYRKNK